MANLIIISELPASGKTTLGKEIAKNLGFSFLDKDEYLENLFEPFRTFPKLQSRIKTEVKSSECSANFGWRCRESRTPQ